MPITLAVARELSLLTALPRTGPWARVSNIPFLLSSSFLPYTIFLPVSFKSLFSPSLPFHLIFLLIVPDTVRESGKRCMAPSAGRGADLKLKVKSVHHSGKIWHLVPAVWCRSRGPLEARGTGEVPRSPMLRSALLFLFQDDVIQRQLRNSVVGSGKRDVIEQHDVTWQRGVYREDCRERYRPLRVSGRHHCR